MPHHPEGFLAPFLYQFVPWLYWHSLWWTVLGFAGGLTFSGRFVLQWIHSEKARRVVVPKIFWHLSFWGSVLNTIYFFHLDAAPAIFANVFLPFLYGRNLYLLYKHQPIKSAGDTDDD
jgi:lipid-A-disaccharide synthase-like uncharacterized protein